MPEMDSTITLMEFDPANFPKVQAAAAAGGSGCGRRPGLLRRLHGQRRPRR
jgi:hypothetical protein